VPYAASLNGVVAGATAVSVYVPDEPELPDVLLELLELEPTGFPAEPFPPPQAVTSVSNNADTNKVQLRAVKFGIKFSFILLSNSVLIRLLLCRRTAAIFKKVTAHYSHDLHHFHCSPAFYT